jgi:hypothetical protein
LRVVFCSNKTKYGIGKVIDLFGGDTIGPAYTDSGKWNGFTFTDRAVTVVRQHAAEEAVKPLFLYMALHNTHAPFEVPAQYADLYNYSFPLQKTWAGMVSMVDETIKNVTTELKAQKMWENTLLIMVCSPHLLLILLSLILIILTHPHHPHSSDRKSVV